MKFFNRETHLGFNLKPKIFLVRNLKCYFLLAQLQSSVKTGIPDLPNAVKEYSTLGGITS